MKPLAAMQKTGIGLLLTTVLAIASYQIAWPESAQLAKDAILSVTMNLSAFGVESDTYPSIVATLDFQRHVNRCERSYYNPAYPNSTYQLTAEEMSQVQQLIEQTDLQKLKTHYSAGNVSDLPTSTTVIRTASDTFTIRDYGLVGASPLPQLYRLVYKFEY